MDVAVGQSSNPYRDDRNKSMQVTKSCTSLHGKDRSRSGLSVAFRTQATTPSKNDQVVSYDVSKHVVPKYNILGHLVSSTKQLKGRRLDSETAGTKMPGNWVRPNTCKEP